MHPAASCDVPCPAADADLPMNTHGEVPREDIPDVELMALAGQGDLNAFEILVERHQASVIGTAAKMLGNPAEAEDIAQMVFLRAWKSASRYTPDAKFTTWLMTITRNLVFNETRRKQRARQVPMEEPPEEGHSEKQFADPSQFPADRQMQDTELSAAVDRAIADLPEAPRMALVLRRYENLSYEEIAKVLETSVPAVKSLLFRARASLKEKLAAFLE